MKISAIRQLSFYNVWLFPLFSSNLSKNFPMLSLEKPNYILMFGSGGKRLWEVNLLKGLGLHVFSPCHHAFIFGVVGFQPYPVSTIKIWRKGRGAFKFSKDGLGLGLYYSPWHLAFIFEIVGFQHCPKSNRKYGGKLQVLSSLLKDWLGQGSHYSPCQHAFIFGIFSLNQYILPKYVALEHLSLQNVWVSPLPSSHLF